MGETWNQFSFLGRNYDLGLLASGIVKLYISVVYVVHLVEPCCSPLLPMPQQTDIRWKGKSRTY